MTADELRLSIEAMQTAGLMPEQVSVEARHVNGILYIRIKDVTKEETRK